MLTLNFNPFPVLTTERLVLRQKTADDVSEVFFLRSDENVMKYIGRPAAKNTGEAIAFIEMITKLIDNNESIAWAITLKGDNRLIGTICLWNIQPENYRGELGYVLHPDHQGKGIMDEAVKAVIAYSFNTLKLHSMEATINPENAASARVLERNNFIREGYFRENYFFEGKFSDSAVYSLVGVKL